ncbi:FAD-dependent oxidoreductase [Mycolicibacterium litorale]|nr:FAD-dependent oxidoreductase [Mycolicibacterium litorale]TDY03294.1 sarcosine oxidase [Mycolicibacterium litorale]
MVFAAAHGDRVVISRREELGVQIAVIGAGAWGLPAAARLAERGHHVILLDRDGVLNEWSSSLGPTRLWRIADPDPLRARLSARAVEAMRRLQSRSGSAVFLRRGLLWRDSESLEPVIENLRALDAGCVEVAAGDVGRYFPGLRPDGRGAVWAADAGIVLAEASLQAQYRLFVRAGGVRAFGRTVTSITVEDNTVRLVLDRGDDALAVDRVVVAAGARAGALLPGLGLEIPLRPYLEQVVHFGAVRDRGATNEFPCLFDGPRASEPGIYAMPSPGLGYKVGMDAPLRVLTEGDRDRAPDPERTQSIRQRVQCDFGAVEPTVLGAQVCSWTDSPDGNFVVDMVGDRVVLACGDCGEGFKFSALMGEILADLAEGRGVDDDVAAWGLARFANGVPVSTGPHLLGRH